MNIRLKKTSREIEKDGGRTKQQKQELIESQTYFVVSKCKLLTEIKKCSETIMEISDFLITGKR